MTWPENPRMKKIDSITANLDASKETSDWPETLLKKV